jgi:flavin-binding protein dodecin
MIQEIKGDRSLASYINEEVQSISGMSVYKVIELVGSSPVGWEEAAKEAIEAATTALTNVRIAEVVEMDAIVKDGRIAEYRAKVRLSFKIEREPETLYAWMLLLAAIRSPFTASMFNRLSLDLRRSCLAARPLPRSRPAARTEEDGGGR